MRDRFHEDRVEIKSSLDAKIADTFRMFDRKNNNCIEMGYVGTILGILGLVPSQQEIAQIIDETELLNRKGAIPLKTFMTSLKRRLENGDKMKPLHTDELLAVFKRVDSKNKGYISRSEFIRIMRKHGESMSDEEFNEMVNAAVSFEDGNKINFEQYTKRLIVKDEGEENSIFKLAAEHFKKNKRNKFGRK